MSSKHCAASGCDDTPTGHSTYCNAHRKANTRHGHPQQTGVTVQELKPYLNKVSKRQAANPDSEAWVILRGRWARIVADAEAVLASHQVGNASVSYEVQAAEQAKHLDDAIGADRVGQTALAMFMMWMVEPRRFRSDKAFEFQLVRRVRGLSQANAGSYWDHKRQQTKRVSPTAVLEPPMSGVMEPARGG